MENYFKDKVIELDNNCLPFDDCDQNVIQMKVKNGTKIKNIVEYSIKHFIDNQNEKQIVINGWANACYKAITCAEILKRKHYNKYKTDLFQMTKVDYKSVEEFWKPIDDNLDVLKVIRKIPVIYILLSRTQLDPNQNGFQYKDSISSNEFINKPDSNKSNRNKRSFKSKTQNNNSKSNASVNKDKESVQD